MLTATFSLFALLAPHADFPGQCEDLTLVMRKGEQKLVRVRRPMARAKVERIIRATAAEMGADPTLLLAIAQHESTMQPAALHVLSGDTRAGLLAWQAGTFSEARAARYQSIIDQGAKHPNFYKAQLGMWRMNRYKSNPHWFTTAQVGDRTINTWTWGYGLYGMAPVLFVGAWDKTSPPWVLCDPVVATATLVWALRTQKVQCAAQGETGTIEQTIARYASGKCGRKMGKSWRGLTRKIKKVSLGTRWKQQDADRANLIQAIQGRLALLEG